MASKKLSTLGRLLTNDSLHCSSATTQSRLTRVPYLLLTRRCTGGGGDRELGIANIDDYDQGHNIGFLRDQLKEIVGSSKAFSEGFANREKLLELLPKSQAELPAKTIKEGLQVAWLKLSEPAVREKYINFMTNVRLGRILEDLDTFAVWTSFMHNNSGAMEDKLVISNSKGDGWFGVPVGMNRRRSSRHS